MKEPEEDLAGIDTVPSLLNVIEWVKRKNDTSDG
jgi:hypothetical protein